MTTIKLTIAALIAIALAGPASASDTYVNGYFKSDGTYVQPHHRTTPNNSTYDNYNSPGGYNPWTGKTYR